MGYCRRAFIFGFFVLLICVPVSCMHLGPKYERPDAGFDLPPSFLQASPADIRQTLRDRWWEAFRDPELNDIVRNVIDRNLDLREAAERVLEKRYRLFQIRADRFPMVGAEGEGRRTGQTVNVVGLTGVRQEDVITETFSLSFPASFELDFWGRMAALTASARWELLAVEENRRLVLQTVVAEAVVVYLQIESIERRIQVLDQSIRDYQRSVDLVQKRYQRGLASVLDLRQARRALYQAEAELPSLRKELALGQMQLAGLMNRYPAASPPRSQPENYFEQLEPVPAGLPSDLLLRRPDIQMAESRLRSLNAAVGAAKASRFPRISLTAALGYNSEKLHLLFDPANELWTLAAGLTVPIFDAGRLEAQQRVTESQYRQGVCAYAKTVLQAFAEVEGALLARREQLERRERLMHFLQEARVTQDVAERRYHRGLVGYLSVLDAQQTRYAAEQRLIQEDFLIFNNRVSLHRSLGGGWDSPMSPEG